MNPVSNLAGPASGLSAWLQPFVQAGLMPYVAASERNAAALAIERLGHVPCVIKVMERAEDRAFHLAYLAANAIGFGNPALKMPNWVYIDCVLMQTAVIGFCIPRDSAPAALIEAFAADPSVPLEALDALPVSGQIAGLALDGDTLIGFSLFSLRKFMPALQNLALGPATKAMALSLYRAEERQRFQGIAQYDNPALKVHARFGRQIEIDQPVMPLHPLGHMTMVYGMKADLDFARIFSGLQGAEPYDILLRADDAAAKEGLVAGRANGQRYIICPPYQIERDGALYLPLRVEKE